MLTDMFWVGVASGIVFTIVIIAAFCSGLGRDWLFRHLFRAENEHIRELVDDVIRLEKEKLDECRNCRAFQDVAKLRAILDLIEQKYPVNTTINVIKECNGSGWVDKST